jgi:signal transduction histidine kinase
MKVKIILSIFVPLLLYGGENIDSLRIELKNLDNEDKYQTLYEMYDYFYDRNSDSSLYYANEKLLLAKNSLDSSRIGTSHLHITSVYLQLNDIDLVKENLNKAKDIFSLSSDSSSIAYYYLFLSYYYINTNRFDQSLKFANLAKTFYSNLNNSVGLGETYTVISAIELALANFSKSLASIFNSMFYTNEFSKKNFVNVYLTLSDIYTELYNYEKAKYYTLEAYKISESDRHMANLARSSIRWGYIYFKLGVFDSAEVYFTKSLNYFKEKELKKSTLRVNAMISELLMSEGKFEESLKLLKNTLKGSEELDLPWLISETSHQLGELYLLQKKYPEALRHILRGLQLAKNIKAKDLELNNYQSLSKYYEETGDYRQAFLTHKMYADLRDSLFIKNQNDITDLQIDYFTKRVKEENELLQKDLSISQLEAEKQRILTTIFILGLSAVLILSFTVIYLYHHKKRNNLILQQKIAAALKAQREQQQIIVHQASLNSLGEYSAGIAHQLNQPLQNIILSIQQIEVNLKESKVQNQVDDQDFKEIYEDMDRVQHTIDHIRLFSSKQQEQYLELFSINESVNNAYRLVRKQYDKLSICLQLNLSPELPELCGNPFKLEQVALNLLANAKDAVEDRQKKSQNGYSKKIKLRTYYFKNQVVLEINDNGSGIPPEFQSKIFLPFYTTKKLGKGQGLGLSIANNIVREFGGYIEVDSNAEWGTDVKVCLPVSRNA